MITAAIATMATVDAVEGSFGLANVVPRRRPFRLCGCTLGRLALFIPQAVSRPTGQPQPARLRGDPHPVEDPGWGGRPRPSGAGDADRTARRRSGPQGCYGWPKTNAWPLTLRLRRIAVRSAPPVKPVVT